MVLPRIQKSNADTKANVVVVKPTIRGPEVEKTIAVQIFQEPTEYYAFAPRKEDVKIHQIWDYIHKGLEDDCSLFYAEFKVHNYFSNFVPRQCNHYTITLY